MGTSFPDEELQTFEHALYNLEQAQDKFRKLKDEMGVHYFFGTEYFF